MGIYRSQNLPNEAANLVALIAGVLNKALVTHAVELPKRSISDGWYRTNPNMPGFKPKDEVEQSAAFVWEAAKKEFSGILGGITGSGINTEVYSIAYGDKIFSAYCGDSWMGKFFADIGAYAMNYQTLLLTVTSSNPFDLVESDAVLEREGRYYEKFEINLSPIGYYYEEYHKILKPTNPIKITLVTESHASMLMYFATRFGNPQIKWDDSGQNSGTIAIHRPAQSSIMLSIRNTWTDFSI